MPYDAIERPKEQKRMRQVMARLTAGSSVHMWLKALSGDAPASVSLAGGDGVVRTIDAVNTQEYEFKEVTVDAGGEITLSFDPAVSAVSVIYAFDPVAVGRDGITVLHVGEANAAPVVPGGYHFRPPFGWMNDPNGFSRTRDRTHLFYQHYPHDLRWNTMHWGHAVSDDMVRWRHLPVFLFPSADLSAAADGRGGAFSGSAIPQGDGQALRVFYTEHVKDREPEEQIQFTALSQDGLTIGPSDLIIAERPTGLNLTRDFRDPYVVKGPDGRWKMLLGSRDRSGGVILLYDTDDADGAGGWTFRGVLHREDRYGMTAAECPCLVPIDGPAEDPATRWALIFGLLTSRDPATGRRNMTLATIGRFDGLTMTKEFEQELDFGTDAYAFQALVDRDGTVGIAWLANWTEITKTQDFPTAMTLPRRLELRDGALATPPVRAVETLRRDVSDDDRLASGETVALDTGAVEIIIDLVEPGCAFDLDLGLPGIALGVGLDTSGLAIRYQPEGGKPTPRYLAADARPTTVRIFLDIGSIEVFADDGRWTGTKRIDSFEPVRSARLIALPGTVARATVWRLGL